MLQISFKILVFTYLAGIATASSDQEDLSKGNSKREAAAAPSYGEPGKEVGAQISVSAEQQDYPQQYHQSKAPTKYSNSIPAAAIRNVETITITKTITPVVTKTTTYKTHSEPAISIGHVQGYSNSATGQSKIAPVTFLTQYTSHANPTTGVNGPVTYTGPAVPSSGHGSGHGQALTFAVDSSLGSLGGSTGIDLSSEYGAPIMSSLESYGVGAQLKQVSNTYEPQGAYSIKHLSQMGPPAAVAPIPYHNKPYQTQLVHVQQKSAHQRPQQQHSSSTPSAAASYRIPQYLRFPTASYKNQLKQRPLYIQVPVSAEQPQYYQLQLPPQSNQNSKPQQYLQVQAASFQRPQYVQLSSASHQRPQYAQAPISLNQGKKHFKIQHEASNQRPHYLQIASATYQQRQQPQYYFGGSQRQPIMTVVQTYAAPSVTLTKNINKVQ